MGNIIAIGAILLILGGAITYIIRAKKQGVHCIGCPTGSTCSGHCTDTYVETIVESTECGCKLGSGCNCADSSSCNCGNH